jgi:hypothetical protein
MMGNAALQRDPGTIVRLPVDKPTLPLLLTVLSDLRRQAISYCYWKSSKRIESVLAGEGDLGILVARHNQNSPQEILLGRAGSDDLLLDQDPSISRHHALLKVEAGRYLIYDLRSTSGVFVNDEKLTDGEGRVLADGNHIRIGNYELIFRCSSTAILHEEKNDDSQKSAADTEIGVSS